MAGSFGNGIELSTCKDGDVCPAGRLLASEVEATSELLCGCLNQ